MKKTVPAFKATSPCMLFVFFLLMAANAHSQNFLCSGPAAQPTGLTLVPYSNNVAGSFLPSIGANGYLVIRTSTITPPSSPADGVTYLAGSTALGGYIESAGSSTSFTTSGLAAATTYYYWVIPYTTAFPCSAITYSTNTPVNALVNTLSCGVVNNVLTLPETGNTAWSAINFSLGHLPTSCEDVTVVCTGILPLNTVADLTISSDVDVRNISFINNSTASSNDKIFHVTLQAGAHLNISGDLTISAAGASATDSVVFISHGTTTVAGNAVIGQSTDNGFAVIGAAGNGSNQTVIFKGNATFNKKSSTRDVNSTMIMAGSGAQTLTNNTDPALTGRELLFDILKIGDGTNAPAVTLAGTNNNFYMNDNGGRLQIMNGALLILPRYFSFNAKDVHAADAFNSNFLIDANATIKAGGDNGGFTGNNFPANFTGYTINSSSTVEYTGSDAITQRVYNGVSYGNLVLSNGSGSGRAAKNTANGIIANTSVTVKSLTDLTLGSTVTCDGAFDVESTGGLYCATNVISGNGAFSLQPGAYLGIGHTQGITAGAFATGNIQMAGGRSFSNAANYIYNGSAAQITGSGLPASCNDLTFDNPLKVTGSADCNAAGTTSVKQGVFDISNKHFTATGPLSFVTGKMKASSGILEFSGTTAQNISGSNFVSRNISTLINSNGAGITLNAAAGDSLLIASRLLFGSGTVNSTITTNDNLTLLSRDTATAGLGEIVSGSGNSISGNVTVERYLGSGRKWRLLSWPTASSQTAMQSWMENNSPNANTISGYGMIITDERTDWSSNGFDSRSVSGPTVKYFNTATNGFTGITNTGSFQMNSQPAYYVFARGDRSCMPSNSTVSPVILRSTGTLKTGDRSFGVSGGAFATIGNPYASAVDLRLLDTTNLTTSFYMWDPKLTGAYGLGAYQTIYQSGADYKVLPGGGSYGPFNSIVNTLESGQAFFVRARAAGGSMGFKENAKTSGVQNMARTGSFEAAFALLSLKDPGSTTLVDGCMTAFDAAFNNSVDYDDALKLLNTGENAGYKREGQLLAIERRKPVTSDDTLYLNISNERIHQYQWDINLQGMDAAGRTALLIDKYMNTSVPLNLNGSTTFVFDVVNIPGSWAADRFMIVLHQDNLLPVHFTSISAVRNADKTVTVKWGAENEINMQDYKIEYSANGNNFAPVGTALPAANNGGSASYEYIDGHATAGYNYYRIRGNSLNGHVDYTAIAKIGPISTEQMMSINPNPVTGNTLNLRFENQPKGNYSVSISNKTGQVLHTETVSVQNGNFTKMITIGSHAAPGSYQAMIMDKAGNITTLPFIVL